MNSQIDSNRDEAPPSSGRDSLARRMPTASTLPRAGEFSSVGLQAQESKLEIPAAKRSLFRRTASVVGMEIGGKRIKAVLLERRHGRPRLVGLCIRSLPDETLAGEGLGFHARECLKECGGRGKPVAAAISSPESFVRIIQQPITPPSLLREAVRINSGMLLHQDCEDWVLDCDLSQTPESAVGPSKTASYLVAGLKRRVVEEIDGALDQARIKLAGMQLAPLAIFNAFEAARPEVFTQKAFILADIGHLQTVIVMGVRRELVLVRRFDFGADAFADALAAAGKTDAETAFASLDAGEAAMLAAGRSALTLFAREVRNSISFFETQRSETITCLFVSGVLAQSETPLRLMQEELALSCERWNPFSACEIAVPKEQRGQLENEAASFNAAFGAAWELLQRNHSG